MNDTKNESIIEIAKKFIDDCNSFEIKNLDADKSCGENSKSAAIKILSRIS